MPHSTASSEWEGPLGEKWAAEWRRTDRSFGMLTERLLQRSRDFTFDSALDIGCGAGELTLALARGRPSLNIIGVDISPTLVHVAEDRAQNLGNASFQIADAAKWIPPQDQAPQLLVSRHGVMFFANPSKAFGHLSRIAADSAHLMFSCFRDRKENGWIGDIARLLPRGVTGPQDPLAPGPFAFANRDHVRSILEIGGWTDVSFESFDYGMVAGTGADPVEDATSYFLTIGPAAAEAREMDPAECDRFADRLRSMLASRVYDGMVILPAAAWIVTARKA